MFFKRANFSLSKDIIDSMISEIDQNGDGCVSTLFSSKKPKNYKRIKSEYREGIVHLIFTKLSLRTLVPLKNYLYSPLSTKTKKTLKWLKKLIFALDWFSRTEVSHNPEELSTKNPASRAKVRKTWFRYILITKRPTALGQLTRTLSNLFNYLRIQTLSTRTLTQLRGFSTTKYRKNLEIIYRARNQVQRRPVRIKGLHIVL